MDVEFVFSSDEYRRLHEEMRERIFGSFRLPRHVYEGRLMTESEWLASSDPGAMLDLLRVWGSSKAAMPSFHATDRKLRLFAAGCCRLVFDRLTDPRSRRAVEVAERYADGEVTEEEWTAFRTQRGVVFDANTLMAVTSKPASDAAQHVAEDAVRYHGQSPAAQAALLRCIFGNPWRPAAPLWERCTWCAGDGLASHEDDERRCRRCGGSGATPESPWLTPTVLALARAAYGERLPTGLLCPQRLAVLSDAMTEAGCDDPDLLGHLRGTERCYRCVQQAGARMRPTGPGGQQGDIMCPVCDSSGRVPAGPVCGTCVGKGRYPFRDGKRSGWKDCPGCSGTGRLPSVFVRGDWVLDLLLGKG